MIEPSRDVLTWSLHTIDGLVRLAQVWKGAWQEAKGEEESNEGIDNWLCAPASKPTGNQPRISPPKEEENKLAKAEEGKEELGVPKNQETLATHYMILGCAQLFKTKKHNIYEIFS